ncbi:hypothetical protein Bca101_072623 [Brassica carinata]
MSVDKSVGKSGKLKCLERKNRCSIRNNDYVIRFRVRTMFFVLQRNSNWCCRSVSDRPSTPNSATNKSADELTPFPDRILAPYSVQFEKVNLSRDKFVESPPLSTRMIEKADVVTNSPSNGYISIYHPLSGSDVKLDGNPSVFGDLFNKKMEFLLVESGMHLLKNLVVEGL